MNGSIEFPPEDDIDIIMRYGGVRNYQSNFQQGGYQNRRYQSNNNFGGNRSNSLTPLNLQGRDSFVLKCYMRGMKISDEEH